MSECLHCGEDNPSMLIDPPIHHACIAPFIKESLAEAGRFKVWRDELIAEQAERIAEMEEVQPVICCACGQLNQHQPAIKGGG